MTEDETTLPTRHATLRVVAMPSDCNITGDVFGGWVMSQVDIAGSIPAVARAKGRVVTVAVNSFLFKKPLFMGDVVSFYADIIKVGRTSITVNVEVYSQRNP
ncbi:MAG: hotdog domain-containing protein, partial [Gallionellaceae bacterium]|nr:hotdog domain-containing protein [Gallionellaceae bacterium]